MNASQDNSTASAVFVGVRIPGAGILGYNTYILITNVLLYSAWLPVTFSGIVSNTINVIVFVNIGMRDSVNVSFLLLSISDLTFLSLTAVFLLPSTLTFSGQPIKAFQNPYTFNSYIVWYSALFYDLSIFITTYISVARCCCVTMALKFRNFFTLFRTYTALGALSTVCLALHVPIIATQNLRWRMDMKTNSSKLTLVRSATYPGVQYFHDVINRNVVPFICLAINIACLAALTFALKSASQVRSKMSGHTPEDISGKSDSKLSVKDIRVVKAVSLVAAMLVFCSLLTTIKALIRRAIPDFDTRGQYRNLFLLVTGIVSFFTYLNASLNMAVYYHFNTKYRQLLRQMIFRDKKL